MATHSEDRAIAKRYLHQQHKEQREEDIEKHLLETEENRIKREQVLHFSGLMTR